jgi:hypothetical protein
LTPAVARAHFVLDAPRSWAEQDRQGHPQKTAPCGQADPQTAAVPTGVVTPFHAGQTITVTINETTYHPGHYRVVLSATGQGGLPADPTATPPGTCESLAIQDPPVFPVLADGVLRHVDPLDGPQSFQVTLPDDVTCTHCTLQVLEFMSVEVGGNGACFYHHCADISIAAAGASSDANGGCGCSTVARRESLGGLLILLGALAVAGLRSRARALLAAAVLIIGGIGGCGDDRTAVDLGASPGDVERVWLGRVGTGSAQTAAVCGRGAVDPIARALCQSPAPALGGLTDLYRTLGLVPGTDSLVAVTTHSLGLSARTVSALNPRTVVFHRYSPLEPTQTAAVAFSRGEPFVELVAYDATANDFNFYLLAFQPACHDCTPRDLLTARIETGWTGWTLYADRDLEDTPLDCTSCHRPDGPGAPRRLLMRQTDGPWMHWGDFRGVSPPTPCPDDTGAITIVNGTIAADGADLLRQVDGPTGQHGGVAVADLIAAQSGYDLSSFLFYAAGYADGPGDVPCVPPYCPFSEPDPFPSQDILCDRLLHGRADSAGGAWHRHRDRVHARGFPVPYYDPDVLGPSSRASVAGDFDAFVAAGGDAFTKTADLIAPDVARAIGFLPDEADTAPAILQKMCVRCHAANTDARLARSRFDATALDSLDAATAQHILDRITLPRTSPDRMPPLRAGELPPWAIDRIAAFLGRSKGP